MSGDEKLLPVLWETRGTPGLGCVLESERAPTTQSRGNFLSAHVGQGHKVDIRLISKNGRE